MPARSAHLSALSLEQLAEGTLAPAEAANAHTHVEVCGRCSAELDAYHSLFGALGDLPRFAPSHAFADGVMARVRIAPQESPLLAWLRRLIPTTRRGWILLGTVIAAPATPIIALVAWLLIQPLVSPTMLWQWLLLRTETATQGSAAWLVDQVVNSALPGLAEALYATMQVVPGSALGGALVLLAIAIPLSAWGLVRLTRTPVGNVAYAN